MSVQVANIRRTIVKPLSENGGLRPNRAAKLESGRFFGGYRLDRQIGVGGMGEVWRATNEHGRLLALKIDTGPAMDELEGAETRAMDLIAGAGGHQAIVGMLGSGNQEGTSFKALEYIEGQNLLEILSDVEEIQGFGLPLRRSLDLLRHVADGVGFIHRLGLIHRDIKLENIMISSGGEVKLIDLGLAGKFPVVSDMGTAVYFSPERVRGQAIGPQADIYSLGIVFFTMLTREHPFARQISEENDSMTLIRMLKNQTTLGLYSFPKPVRSLIKGMLAYNPEERFRNCAEIIKAVDSAFNSLPKEEGRWERFIRKTAWKALRLLDYVVDKLPGWLVPGRA